MAKRLPMLNDAACFEKVFIACGRTDLRRGIDTVILTMDIYDKNLKKLTVSASFFKSYQHVV